MITISLAMIALAGGAPDVPPMGDPATIDAIIKEGKGNSQVMKKLTELCTTIGPRLTGSPQLSAGQRWAMKEFTKLGLKNVYLDEWGETPVGFDRGPHNSARLVTPDRTEDLVFTTNCWTNGTNGVVKAEAVLCPDSVEAIDAAKESLRGKWVVLPAPEAPAGGRGGPRPAGGLGGGGATPPPAVATPPPTPGHPDRPAAR